MDILSVLAKWFEERDEGLRPRGLELGTKGTTMSEGGDDGARSRGKAKERGHIPVAQLARLEGQGAHCRRITSFGRRRLSQ